MSISGRNAPPLSPISLGGSEWSVSKYQLTDDTPHSSNRLNVASSPVTAGPNGKMSMNGFPTGPRSTGGPSPPASIARSSNGTNIYAGSDNGRNSVRSDLNESVLNEHYVALRTFLNTRDPNHKQQPNKARDKLLRLSSVQFYELSTDVYDELIRRQATARAPPNGPNGPPAFLLPEKTFHPKRNQARQRLSSLGPPRFRDLAADVFHELERRFPRFIDADGPRAGSPMSMRGGPASRSGTPINGNGYPSRDQSRIRRPSDASSMRGPASTDAYPPPTSPGIPNGDYGRPTAKQLHQNNTIVPNKSTMLEEDDDGGADDDGDAFALEGPTNNRESKRSQASGGTSEADRKLMEESQSQVRELREKLDHMEDAMKKQEEAMKKKEEAIKQKEEAIKQKEEAIKQKEEAIKQKEDELSSIRDEERSRTVSMNAEKDQWADIRRGLESKLSEAQTLNDSMRQELDRMREDHDAETQQLRDQVVELQQNSRSIEPVVPVAAPVPVATNSELEQENEELRNSLHEQQRVTEDVRREAQEFLREMKMLSQQSGMSHERHAELEKIIEHLEHEVHEWKNRYARTKTQLRSLRASSVGVAIEEDATQYLRDKGFADDNGLVKDVHVTKFQVAIEELLQRARKHDPEHVIDAMKSVVVSVRRITKDVDETPVHDEEVTQQQAKLRSKVSTTANNLITASKNFAASAGISPVSLIDASASHLTAAVVELLRFVKIRATPTEELEEEDEGTVTPVDSTGFFSPRSTSQPPINQNTLPPPPPFQGLGGIRASEDSSAYSPVNSPRQSADPYGHSQSMSKPNGVTNGMGYPNANHAPMGGYGAQQQDNRDDELRQYLENQTALLVSDIQNLVGSIRSEADIRQITTQIGSISAIVGKIIAETYANSNTDMVTRLAECKERLLEAGERGQDMANIGVKPTDHEWRMWSQTLPPIAFEIAREAKELVQKTSGSDDFS